MTFPGILAGINVLRNLCNKSAPCESFITLTIVHVGAIGLKSDLISWGGNTLGSGFTMELLSKSGTYPSTNDRL